MTKVDIFSGFLGAGKTTLIKKLIKEAYKGEMIVVIENEFGKIGIDGGFLKEAGIQITEQPRRRFRQSSSAGQGAVRPRQDRHRAFRRRQAERRYPRRTGREHRRARPQRLHDGDRRVEMQDVHEELCGILPQSDRIRFFRRVFTHGRAAQGQA